MNRVLNASINDTVEVKEIKKINIISADIDPKNIHNYRRFTAFVPIPEKGEFKEELINGIKNLEKIQKQENFLFCVKSIMDNFWVVFYNNAICYNSTEIFIKEFEEFSFGDGVKSFKDWNENQIQHNLLVLIYN